MPAAPLTSLSSTSPSSKYCFCYFLPQELGKASFWMLSVMNTVFVKHGPIWRLLRQKRGRKEKMHDKCLLSLPTRATKHFSPVSLGVRHHRDHLESWLSPCNPNINIDLLQLSQGLHISHFKILYIHYCYYIYFFVFICNMIPSRDKSTSATTPRLCPSGWESSFTKIRMCYALNRVCLPHLFTSP